MNYKLAIMEKGLNRSSKKSMQENYKNLTSSCFTWALKL
jgi:hypothetical protein